MIHSASDPHLDVFWIRIWIWIRIRIRIRSRIQACFCWSQNWKKLSKLRILPILGRLLCVIQNLNVGISVYRGTPQLSRGSNFKELLRYKLRFTWGSVHGSYCSNTELGWLTFLYVPIMRKHNAASGRTARTSKQEDLSLTCRLLPPSPPPAPARWLFCCWARERRGEGSRAPASSCNTLTQLAICPP